MGLVSKPNTFASGAAVIAAEFNSNYDTIYNEFNGKIDNNNIKSGAGLVDSKLASITSANKVALSALTVTGQTPGSLAYFDGSTWTKLDTGGAGTILRVNATATGLAWS